jgi:ribosome-associated protein
MSDLPDEFDEGPSKSELKRRSHDLQAVGESLIGLSQRDFDAMPLPDELRDAVALARRIKSRGALYRQKQFIGKIMRRIDAEPIRAALLANRKHRAGPFRRQPRSPDGNSGN